MDWGTVISTAGGIVAGGLITAYFSWRGSKELRREAEKQRRATLTVIRILDGAGLVEVTEWDPVTDEPSKWRVTSSKDYAVEHRDPGGASIAALVAALVWGLATVQTGVGPYKGR